MGATMIGWAVMSQSQFVKWNDNVIDNDVLRKYKFDVFPL